MATKTRKVLMHHINIGDLARGRASRSIKDVADKNKPACVLRYGKPVTLAIPNERYERLISEGFDRSKHRQTY